MFANLKAIDLDDFTGTVCNQVNFLFLKKSKLAKKWKKNFL